MSVHQNNFGLRYLWLALFVLLISTFALANDSDGLVNLNEIVSKLDPMEFVDNVDGVRRSVNLDIRFEFASAALSDEADRQIEALGGALQSERLAGYRIEIIGHTDAIGAEAANQALSEARAASVRQALIEGYGIIADRLVAIGMGESALLENIAEDSAKQRRVEIVAIPFESEEANASGASKQKVRRNPLKRW